MLSNLKTPLIKAAVAASSSFLFPSSSVTVAKTVLPMMQQKRDLSFEPLIFRAGTLAAGLWGFFVSKREWEKKNFLRRVNLSLCDVKSENGSNGPYNLQIRTLLERDIERILLRNSTLVRIVLRAAAKTTAESPFLILPAEDSWFALSAILNELSSKFSTGHIQADIFPEHVHTEYYWFGLTREFYEGNQRFEKIRIMLLKESTLNNWTHIRASQRTCLPEHDVRWRTLDVMAQLYEDQMKRQQARGGNLKVTDQHNLMRIALCVPRP